MKKLLLLITLISLPSYAAVSANVSFASDYIWRGMTQSDGPAIQGGFDFEADGGCYVEDVYEARNLLIHFCKSMFEPKLTAISHIPLTRGGPSV